MRGYLKVRYFCCALLGIGWALPLSCGLQLPNTKRLSHSREHKQLRVVIVGGGIGGLAVASRIKARLENHVQVTILERNARVGGRCGSFTVNLPRSRCFPSNREENEPNQVLSFRHEYGPSLLLLPHVYEELFTDCRSTPETHGLQWKRCAPAYQCVFEDGDRILVGYPENCDEFKTEIAESRRRMNTWEPDGANKWDSYMRACEAFLDCGLPNFIEENIDIGSFPPFIRESLRDFGKAWPLKPHSDVLDEFFASEKMKALASFQDLYVGLEPFRNHGQPFGGIFDSTAPAVFGLLSAIELHPTNPQCGVFAPIGGFQAVAESLEKLAVGLGVNIFFNQTVTRVTGEGVHFRETNQLAEQTHFMPSNLTVINADLPYAAKCLVGDEEVSLHDEVFDWVEKQGKRELRFSSGVVAFHWSVNRTLNELSTHNVFLSAGNRNTAKRSWSVLRNQHESFEADAPFNFYVHRASSTDPSAAPSNCDAILVLVPSKILEKRPEFYNLSRNQVMTEYQKQFDVEGINRIRSALLQRLSVMETLSDLENCIIDEVVDTPATYAADYNVAAGTPFGLSHGLGQLSINRPGASFMDLPRTLAVGSSSKPGNGVPLVMLGAKAVAKLMVDRLQNELRFDEVDATVH